jgi:hypothetical protein
MGFMQEEAATNSKLANGHVSQALCTTNHNLDERDMKALVGFILLAVGVCFALCTAASSAPLERDVSKLSPDHAKLLLGLLQHRAQKTYVSSYDAVLRSFFEPSPYDHCCLVWDNLKCAASILQCVSTCETGLQPCITCLGPMWEQCCCCLDNAGIHGLQCPTCCTH